MLSVFCSPSRYTQGRGATAALGREMAALGLEGPVLLIAGKTVISRLANTWKVSLGEAGISNVVHCFAGECSPAEIERTKAMARQSEARTIIGAGGGKVLDTGSCCRCRFGAACRELPDSRIKRCPLQCPVRNLHRSRSFPGIPVLSQEPGLGACRHPGDRRRRRRACSSPAWETHSPPGSKRKPVSLDRCSTCAAVARQPVHSALAELCYRTLLADGAAALQAVLAQAVTPALERLVEANTLLSGLGFESSGLAAAHAIHNGLTAVPETHAYFHGEKVAFGLLVQLVLEGATSATVNEVLRFSFQVGLPITLADIGLAELASAIASPRSAHRATAPGETIHNEPFEVNSDMVTDAILAADAVGRAWKNQHGTKST